MPSIPRPSRLLPDLPRRSRRLPRVRWCYERLAPGPLLGPYVLRARVVLERFEDFRGHVVRLSCGHFRRDTPTKSGRRRFCEPCRLTGRGGEVPELHDIRCGCTPCTWEYEEQRARRLQPGDRWLPVPVIRWFPR